MRPGSTAITENSWIGGLTSLMTWAMLALVGCGGSGGGTDLSGVADESASETVPLTRGEVQTIIAQAASQATASGLPVTIAVVDHEGVVLGVLRMGGATVARADIRLTGGGAGGLDGITLAASLTPIVNATAASDAAISKAGTAAFFSTQRNAF